MIWSFQIRKWQNEEDCVWKLCWMMEQYIRQWGTTTANKGIMFLISTEHRLYKSSIITNIRWGQDYVLICKLHATFRNKYNNNTRVFSSTGWWYLFTDSVDWANSTKAIKITCQFCNEKCSWPSRSIRHRPRSCWENAQESIGSNIENKLLLH